MVEDVKVAFVGSLGHHPRLLQQVVDDFGALYLAVLAAHLHVDILTKARRVVIADRLGIAESLQNGIAGEDLVLYTNLLCRGGHDGLPEGANRGHQIHAVLGIFGLTGTTLTADHDGLVLARLEQTPVSLGS